VGVELDFIVIRFDCEIGIVKGRPDVIAPIDIIFEDGELSAGDVSIVN
jgi:hypothetical protein